MDFILIFITATILNTDFHKIARVSIFFSYKFRPYFSHLEEWIILLNQSPPQRQEHTQFRLSLSSWGPTKVGARGNPPCPPPPLGGPDLEHSILNIIFFIKGALNPTWERHTVSSIQRT
jgi:hypothetical protein